MTVERAEVRREQAELDRRYARLDAIRARAEVGLANARGQQTTGTAQAASERDAFVELYTRRLAQLDAVTDRLVFGRIDLRDGTSHYVGRVGLTEPDGEQLLVDWRAPAARPFYEATAAHAGDVVRRRHVSTRGRTVIGVEDDALDADALGEEGRSTLVGEGALFAAMNARRTGRMHDIVATIQAEQDAAIRAPLSGVLVVQGGPGTGKTAVALHRAAYLLYAHRERLARRGVLIVGPNPVFLRYIERVLPSLGEAGVVMATIGTLFPGVETNTDGSTRAAILKGDLRFAGAIEAAVRARQRVPRRPVPLDVDGNRLLLRPRVVDAARARARRTRRPHNEARVVFARHVLNDLAGQLARALHIDLDDDARPGIMADLHDSLDVRREVNLCWMPLTPQRLLADLLADERKLATAAPWLTHADRAALRRHRDAAWTVSDVPLLDEAAELLGEHDEAAAAQSRRAAEQRRTDIAYARGVLEMSGASGGLVTAENLADRFGEAPAMAAVTAELAAADRTWAYGHVVVDEAQELSPMAWRMLMRRCPAKSMTLVGDVAQTGAAAGARSWSERLDPHADGRWRMAELTVNYRTPGTVMAIAVAMARAAGLTVTPPQSVREGDQPPVAVGADSLTAVVAEEFANLDGGRLAVIVPRGRVDGVAESLAGALPHGTVDVGAAGLDASVLVAEVGGVKGLEFDAVVVVEPSEILAASANGVNDLYVALTRTTNRLRVVTSAPLPAGMEELASRL